MSCVLQDGKTLENEIEVVEGMRFDRGYISPYFVTDTKTQMCELENPVILIVEKKVTTNPRVDNVSCSCSRSCSDKGETGAKMWRERASNRYA